MASDIKTIRPHNLLIMGLILIGIFSRFAPHLPNATPLIALALFGGTYLSRRWAILLPLTIVVVSDVVIGLHSTILFTWGAFALTGMIAWWIRLHPSPSRIVSGALLGSVLFFLITNFGVWFIANMYPLTIAGLWQCYVAAVPFFRSSLMADIVYTALFFGCYALLKHPRAAIATSESK